MDNRDMSCRKARVLEPTQSHGKVTPLVWSQEAQASQLAKCSQRSAAKSILDTLVAGILATDNSASADYASEFIHLIIKFS